MEIALLMFNYNENDGIIRNIELLKDIVNEILIVDSSNIYNYQNLKNKYDNLSNLKILRVFPIGYVEPFRMFALKNINSEYVLYLDADEEPNNELIKYIKNLKDNNISEDNDISGYYILRYEKSLKCYTYQLRLYKKEKAFYKGMIHEFPKINGKIKKLDDEKFIIHYADFNNYINTRSSYLLIEAYERPFSIFYLSLNWKVIKFFGDGEKILPKIFVYLFALLLFLRRTLNYDSLKLKTYRYDKFLMKYTIKRYKYFMGLECKDYLIKVNMDIIQNNGIIKYLNLDDISYVNRLTENFNWKKKGIDIFKELVDYRYNNKKFKEEI